MDRSRNMYIFLLVLTVACYAGFQGWRTMFNNFAVEVAAIDGFQMGVIQSVREVPGFLALLAVYLLLIISEHRLAALSVAIMGAGIGLTGYMPTFGGIVFTTLVMSFGFHYFETMNQSLTLQYFDTTTAPIVFGRLRAVAAATSIGVGAVIWGATYFFAYHQIFMGIAVVVIAMAGWCLFQNPTHEHVAVQRKEMVLRKRYWLFYLLTLLGGARRQIFVAFAVFLLVKKFDFSVQEIIILFVVNNTIAYFANPLIGKAVNRFGERRVLSVEYVTLIGVFLVYAYSESKILVAAMYILDHLVFNFAMAIRTFFQKIADPGDIAPSMAVGFTINHIAAVVIPTIGGLMWLKSSQLVFMGGVALAIASLVATQLIDRELAKGRYEHL